MTKKTNRILAAAIAGILTSSAIQAQTLPQPVGTPSDAPNEAGILSATKKLIAATQAAPAVHKPIEARPVIAPVELPDATRASASTLNSAGVFGGKPLAQAATPTSTTLSPPVSIVYNGSSPAINVATTGTSKAVQASINNTANTSSALYGQTNGAGGGVTGYNGGTTGFAGKFGITNSASTQPAILASTTGTGAAIQATATNASNFGPAILAQSNAGIGLRAYTSSYYAVLAQAATGVGVYAYSDSGSAFSGYAPSGAGIDVVSGTGDAVKAASSSGSAVEARAGGDSTTVVVTNYGGGRAIEANAANATAVFGQTTSANGVYGYASANGTGVYGYAAGNGYGVVGSSGSGGYAGYFIGKVAATSYATLSDRNAKRNFKSIDGADLLARVNRLPITTWDFKTDDKVRHLGPMAQDFHEQFGLNGSDDKHINLTDMAGVSLAAIQELTRQGQNKDAEIALLRARLEAQAKTIATLNETMEARFAALEHAAVTPKAQLTAASGKL